MSDALELSFRIRRDGIIEINQLHGTTVMERNGRLVWDSEKGRYFLVTLGKQGFTCDCEDWMPRDKPCRHIDEVLTCTR